MLNVSRYGTLDRAVNVAIVSAGVYVIPYAFISNSPWHVILPIMGVVLIALVVIGLPNKVLRVLKDTKLEKMAGFLAVLLSLVCFLAFGLVGALLLFGLTRNIPLPDQGGIYLLMGSLLASLANLIMLAMNVAVLLLPSRASERT